MTNHEAAQKVLNDIKANGFKPSNVKCETEENDISKFSFSIKGLFGWKFGMWVCTSGKFFPKTEDENPPIVLFFCQHKFNKYIRFAYPYNYLRAELDEWDFRQSSTKWWIWRITDILTMIKRHPFISYTMDERRSQYYDKSYILNFAIALLRRLRWK